MGEADDCPFTGTSEFNGYLCLVRDVNDPALTRLNEKVFKKSTSGLILGTSLLEYSNGMRVKQSSWKD